MASGSNYDSGDFPGVLQHALEGLRTAQAAASAGGCSASAAFEVTAPPSKEMGGIRFEADGTVTIITGTLDYGQGHAAPFARC